MLPFGGDQALGVIWPKMRCPLPATRWQSG